MPQIVQLPYIFASQLFWLAVVFGIIFFVIGRGMLPKIQSTVELREKQIADDLERAQAARSEAEETEAAWRARMDVAGADAARIAQEAKQDSAAKTEAKVRAAAGGVGRCDAGHGCAADGHQNRREGSRWRGEGGTECLSFRP